MTRGVILDIDGTLVISNDAHAWSFVQALAQVGHPVPFERIRPLIGMGSDQLLAALGLSSEDQRQEIARAARHIFLERFAPRLVPTPGSRALVQAMKERGLKLAIATSAPGEEMETLLHLAQIEDLVQRRTSASDVARAKPSPDVIEAALGELDLPPHQAIMLADTPFDLQACSRAGVGMIAVRTGGWSDLQLTGALAIYDNPLDLLAHYDISPLAGYSQRG